MAKKPAKNAQAVVEETSTFEGLFQVIHDNAADFVVSDDWKSAADWKVISGYLVCEFVRSEADGKNKEGKTIWKELNRSRVLAISLNDLPQAVIEWCASYGMKQVVADRNFAMGKEEFTTETERARLKKAEGFLKEMFETGKIPVKRKTGLSPEQKKERQGLIDALAAAMKKKDWALAGQISDKMESLGYEL